MATDGEPPEKKFAESINGDALVLNDYELAEVLKNDSNRKVACLHLRRKMHNSHAAEDAVLILNRKPFTAEDFQSLSCLAAESAIKLAQNDIYGNYDLNLPAECNRVKSTFIYPATKKHIDKYRQVEFHMVAETYEDYLRATLPYIEESKFSLQWIENILNGTAETERIFYNDSEFLLAPDLKWDGVRVENLYIAAICHQRGIKSIRDLTTDHLPLLRNILKKGTVSDTLFIVNLYKHWAKGELTFQEAICEKYHILSEQLRIFFHYQPSYYHLHVHFVHVMHEAEGTAVGGAHLLADVIENIELMPDYYQKKTLYYTLKVNNPLLQRLRGEPNRKN